MSSPKDFELRVGDVVVSPTYGVYTVIGEQPGDKFVIRRLSILASCTGEIFQYPVVKSSRADLAFPFVHDGVLLRAE